MRIIRADKIKNLVSELCILANLNLRKDVLTKLKSSYSKEKNKRANQILFAIIQNAKIAREEGIAICQDTGMPVVFVGIGQEVFVSGDLKAAIMRGVGSGYKKGFLRGSVAKNPLKRGKPGYLPCVIHIDIVKGNKIKLTVLPKGFGCENKSALKMFKPTAGISEIKKFIVDTVKSAGPDACPPYIVGVGIGGTADYAGLLAKKALLRKLQAPSSLPVRQAGKLQANYKLEYDLLREINKLNIGPMGLGGKTTALAVNIETYPTHISGLPVAVNISCHALRSATGIL
ncbi:MAG: fumarate hydratase [Candidatus Omnitrophica bacterium]|nr:fumarate hydratase [Candidatus Omnitrophota bacterium]